MHLLVQGLFTWREEDTSAREVLHKVDHTRAMRLYSVYTLYL